MKNYIKFAVISFVLGALLACSKNDANKVTVLLDWTINTNHTGLFVAQELGYFTDAGLKVDILPATADGVAADVVAAGRAQFTFMDQNDLTSAIDNNLPLLGLATIYPNNHSAFVSLANSGISRPRDFAGRRYMGWGGALEEKIIKTLIALDGGDPNLLEIVPTLGMSDISSLTAGFADIIWYYEGWDGVMAKLLGVNLNKVPLASFPTLNFYSPTLVVSNPYLLNNEARVRAFMQAVAQGYYYAAANPNEASRILLKYAPGLNYDLVTQSQQFLSPRYLDDEGRFGFTLNDYTNSYTQWLYDNNLINQFIPSDKIFSNRYLPNSNPLKK